MSDLIKITGLWKNEKNGKTYLSGSLGGARVLIFENSYKEKDNHPDYQMFLAPKQEKRDDGPRDEPAPTSVDGDSVPF